MDTNETPKGQWTIVIDTDSYAGNFERPMVEFITGLNTYGGNFAHEFHAAYETTDKEHGFNWEEDFRNPFMGVFVKWPDGDVDWPSLKYAHLEPTPGYGKDGMGNVIPLDGTAPKHKVKDSKYQAYNSVKIYCYDKPSEEHVSLIKEWTEKFAARSREEKPKPPKDWTKYQAWRNANPFHHIHPVNILGVRVVCEPQEEKKEQR